MGRYLDVAKRATEGAEQSGSPATPRPTPLEFAVSDPYAKRIQAALRAMNRPDYPAGMIPWLGEAHPDLYDELTRRIPDEINLAWKCQAPLAEFDAILARLVETHRQACELYRERSRKGAGTVLESRQGGE